MDIPPGLKNKVQPNKVCRLRKSLYGLKQSPMAWFERFRKVLKEDQYKQCQANHTLFVKHQGGDNITILILYADDIVLTGNDENEIR